MIDFLNENLRSADFGDVTRELVLAAAPRGTVEETADGWPYLVLPTQDAHIVDAPLGYTTLEQLASERGAQVILYGLGVGHAARAVRGAGARLCFIFEPDPGVVRSYLERGPYDLAGVRIVSDVSELEQSWSQLVGDASRIEMLDTPGYAQARPEERENLTVMISNLLERKVVNDLTFRARGKSWISHAIENAPFMAAVPSAMHLNGAFPGVPAFIVGAGPSLEKNIQLLREARQKGLIFAVNASGGALDRAKVDPQILGCIESLDLSHLLSGLSFIDQAVRVLSLSAHPGLFHAGRGPVLSMYEQLPQVARPFESFFRRGAVPVCGSVTTAMVSLALRMGCSPIVLVGQDLAYTEGRAYSTGTAYANNELRFGTDGATVQHFRKDAVASARQADGPAHERVERVPAWGGEGTVVSTMSFGHVRLWLERFSGIVGKLAKPPRLINATEGGSSIAGFEELPLSEVVGELSACLVSPADLVREAKARGPQVTLEQVSDFLLQQAEGARVVGSEAQKLHEASRRAAAYWREAHPEVLKELLSELHERELALRGAVASWPWVDTWCWREVDGVVGTEASEAPVPVLRGIEMEARLAEAIDVASEELALKLERGAADLFRQVRASA